MTAADPRRDSREWVDSIIKDYLVAELMDVYNTPIDYIQPARSPEHYAKHGLDADVVGHMRTVLFEMFPAIAVYGILLIHGPLPVPIKGQKEDPQGWMRVNMLVECIKLLASVSKVGGFDSMHSSCHGIVERLSTRVPPFWQKAELRMECGPIPDDVPVHDEELEALAEQALGMYARHRTGVKVELVAESLVWLGMYAQLAATLDYSGYASKADVYKGYRALVTLMELISHFAKENAAHDDIKSFKALVMKAVNDVEGK